MTSGFKKVLRYTIQFSQKGTQIYYSVLLKRYSDILFSSLKKVLRYTIQFSHKGTQIYYSFLSKRYSDILFSSLKSPNK